MGNQKQKWTAEEEEALLAGITKHGPGKWKNILKDPEFAPFLTHRSNIDLKDKWRNLSVSTNTQTARDKSRAPKVKGIVDSLPNTPNSFAPAASHSLSVTTDAGVGDSSNNSLDGKNAPSFVFYSFCYPSKRHLYNTMIFEALSTIKDTNGHDISAIVSYIEAQNCYKIKEDTLIGTETPIPKQKNIRLRQNFGAGSSGETVEAAAITAAYKVVEAENKSFLAAEAMKEAERVSKMAEDTDSMLQLVKEIYEQCSRGETVLLA
ncbi:glycylpeptide N-tetradecanoyltransferase 1-like isoform X1 [Hibiscus syriacus]|uniref:MYB transcription factor n=1 Tax=Hibiscus syriacus TaxID=106335 RepID=A0A6A3AAH4_HIBSY|nr:glycylpeptide N-tetradecanoyltransferase 1-like isoform X1 [Hibiscus syriacus]